jgi:hypothetical protein
MQCTCASNIPSSTCLFCLAGGIRGRGPRPVRTCNTSRNVSCDFSHIDGMFLNPFHLNYALEQIYMHISVSRDVDF